MLGYVERAIAVIVNCNLEFFALPHSNIAKG